MKKRINLALMMLLMVVLLSGCQLTDHYSDKTKLVFFSGSSGETSSDIHAEIIFSNSAESERNTMFLVAERDLQYHWKAATELSGTGNIAYNVSYLLNLPAKLYRNIQADLGIGKYFNESSMHSTGLDKKVDKTASIAAPIVLIVMDVLYAIVGLFGAFIMLIFGTLTGLLYHPINTFKDIPGLLVGLVKTIYYAVAHFFYW
ncbi:hypothetical protein [Paenibacillus sp. SN-8-1]|uniref:hypothetical protein n=1 Tax=Paenibacillus sp. SN-8-1 TaxID=3435409 RepID=UPI003D9AAA30